MKKNIFVSFNILFLIIILMGCKSSGKGIKTSTESHPNNTLPPPYETKSTKNFSKVIGWKNDLTPVAPAGFTVTKFADGLDHPRWIYVGENGDIFIAESNTKLKGIIKLGAKLSRKIKTQHVGESADRITMFRDADKDGMADEWEKKNGLNPADASDATKYANKSFYTNIEVYLNSLVKIP